MSLSSNIRPENGEHVRQLILRVYSPQASLSWLQGTVFSARLSPLFPQQPNPAYCGQYVASGYWNGALRSLQIGKSSPQECCRNDKRTAVIRSNPFIFAGLNAGNEAGAFIVPLIPRSIAMPYGTPFPPKVRLSACQNRFPNRSRTPFLVKNRSFYSIGGGGGKGSLLDIVIFPLALVGCFFSSASSLLSY